MQNGQLSASSCQTSAADAPITAGIAIQSQDSEDSASVDTVLSETFVSTALASTIDVSALNVQSFIPNLPITSSVALDAAPVPTTSGGGTQGLSIGGANAMPFLPSGGSVAAAVSAAPFVPKSKQNLLSGGTSTGGVSGGMGRAQLLAAGQAFVGIGGGPQPQQISQMRQQLQQQMQQVAAQAQAQALADAQAKAAADARREAADKARQDAQRKQADAKAAETKAPVLLEWPGNSLMRRGPMPNSPICARRFMIDTAPAATAFSAAPALGGTVVKNGSLAACAIAG